MNLAEIVAVFRYESDDEVAPYKISNTRAIEFANDAENQACRRARLLRDASTEDVCIYTVDADDETVPLHASVLFVRRAIVDGESRPLLRKFMADMDAERPGWETEVGPPIAFIPDFESGKLRLYPIPEEGLTLNLQVIRLPLAPMVDIAYAVGPPEVLIDIPEIPARLHRELVYWMLHRLYSKKDSANETRDDKLADDYERRFAAVFGPASSAIDETWISERHDPEDGVF